MGGPCRRAGEASLQPLVPLCPSLPLVPKFRLGTHGREALLPVRNLADRPRGREAALPDLRSQAGLGTEGGRAGAKTSLSFADEPSFAEARQRLLPARRPRGALLLRPPAARPVRAGAEHERRPRVVLLGRVQRRLRLAVEDRLRR